MDKDVQELLSRGVSEVIDKKHLEERLLSGEKLRVKLGIDPTSPNIHIGRAISLLKLRDFQNLGHTAVFIVGDFTGMIGDTSDKDAERPMLSQEQVEENMRTYLDQAFRILDKDKTETYYNSSWLEKLGYLEVSNMAALFSVHEFESRNVIARRLKAGQRVSTVEMFYPLMQGYDSVAVKADVELGGIDQRYNLLAGRRIQPLYNQPSQDIMMLDLIEGTDGRKMSSSWGNVIAITEEPQDMFGKVMTIKDELVEKYFELCTRVPLSEVEEILKGHPKAAKERLAKEIVTMYHSADAAEEASKNFLKPSSAEEIKIPSGSKLRDLAETLGLSVSELRRLVEAGAIETEAGEKVGSVDAEMRSGVYRVGKHRFVKFSLS